MSGKDGIKHELTGQVKMTMGTGKTLTMTTMDLLSLPRGAKGQMLGSIEGMLGVKGEMTGQHSMSWDKEGFKHGLKGSLSAFAGGTLEMSPQLRIIDSAGKTLHSTTLTGGLAYGLGGSYEGEMSWTNGKLIFKSKGKMSAGLGFSFGMAAEINIGQIISNIFFG
jgi:hypothetical protein